MVKDKIQGEKNLAEKVPETLQSNEFMEFFSYLTK